jgi:hypothetical protein
MISVPATEFESAIYFANAAAHSTTNSVFSHEASHANTQHTPVILIGNDMPVLTLYPEVVVTAK